MVGFDGVRLRSLILPALFFLVSWFFLSLWRDGPIPTSDTQTNTNAYATPQRDSNLHESPQNPLHSAVPSPRARQLHRRGMVHRLPGWRRRLLSAGRGVQRELGYRGRAHGSEAEGYAGVVGCGQDEGGAGLEDCVEGGEGGGGAGG